MLLSSYPPQAPLQFAPKDLRFERGQFIPSNGNAYWLIQEGFIRTLTWDIDGTVTTLGIWGAGDVISHNFSAISPYEIECMSPVRAMLVSPDRNLTQILLSHCRCTEELLSITHTRQISNRLIKLLQWLGNRFGQPTIEGALRITLRITHQQLAEILGTTRVTVTRLLGVLQKENVVKRLPKYQFLLTKDTDAIAKVMSQNFN
jgi:CRP-like cAMP-binding protein